MNMAHTLNVATAAVWPVLVDAALKAAAIFAGAWAVTLPMRRASAASRHVVWMIATTLAVVMPLLSAMLPRWNVAVLPRPAVASVEQPAAEPVLAGGIHEAPARLRDHPPAAAARPLVTERTSAATSLAILLVLPVTSIHLGTRRAAASAEVTVPEMPGGRSDEPLIVPPIPMKE